MPGINMTMPIQIILQMTIAADASRNLTLVPIQNPSLATQAPILPSGYVAFPEYGVAYKLFDNKLNHNLAKRMCSNWGGQLAVIDSREKVATVLGHFDSFIEAWVGAIKREGSQEWTTIDGKSINDVPWGEGSPFAFNNVLKAECVTVDRYRNGLSNFFCDTYRPRKYLCEIALRSH